MANYVSELSPIFPGVNSAGWEVDRKFTDSYARVEEAKIDLDTFSDNLDSYIEGLHLDLGDDNSDSFDVDVPEGFEITGTFPEFNYGSWPVSASPTAPTLTGLAELSTVILDEAPPNTVQDPGFELPSKPIPGVITEPGQAPELNQIELPITPEFIVPDDPTISEITIGETPSVEVPVFTAEKPTDNLDDVPVPDFDYVEAVYSSDIWAPLAEKIRDGIINGGTGLSPDVEQLIYDSARYRQDVEGEAVLDEARRKYSGKGFDLPQGAKITRERNIIADISRDKTELNGKIAIDQAELAQKNTHFMLEKGINLEQITIGFYDAQANRTLEAKKISAEIVGQIAKLYIDKYNARAQVYNITAQAYEAELKAAFADLEAFKVEMEGKKVASDVQKNVVEVYVAQVGALETRAKLYTAQVDGAKAEAELERLKMENYKITVDAYVARQDAEKSKYQVYATEVDAEKTKVQAYAEQVKAYVSEIEAVRATNDGRIQQLNATISYNASLIDKFKAEILGFDSRVKEIAQQHDVAIRHFDSSTTSLTAQAGVVESKNNLVIKGIDTAISGERLKLDAERDRVTAIRDGYVALMDLEGKSRLGIFNATAQLMSSAMSSVSAQASTSDGMSRGYSANQSISNSLSEQHSYNQSA